jgi:hypothetical protein
MDSIPLSSPPSHLALTRPRPRRRDGPGLCANPYSPQLQLTITTQQRYTTTTTATTTRGRRTARTTTSTHNDPNHTNLPPNPYSSVPASPVARGDPDPLGIPSPSLFLPSPFPPLPFPSLPPFPFSPLSRSRPWRAIGRSGPVAVGGGHWAQAFGTARFGMGWEGMGW